MGDSELGPWGTYREKYYASTPFEGNENPFEGIPDPPRPNTSIWAQCPMTTPNQWGAAAEAAYVSGQWISPDWTSLQVTEYWIGFYEHRKVMLLPEAYWKEEDGK